MQRFLVDGRPPAVLWIAPAVLLVLALPDNLGLAVYPRGYFTFLALVVTLAAGVLAFLRLKGDAQGGWGWTFVAVALLYNPAWPPVFTGGYWLIFNAASAAIFMLGGRRLAQVETHEPASAQETRA